MLLVKDVEFHSVEAQFHEAVFTHASTSPNQQLIASLDVARRQMELEGYGLVHNAIEVALDIRQAIAKHPLISKYFHVLGADKMVPEKYRESGFTDFLDSEDELGRDASQHARRRVLPRSDAHDPGVRNRRLRRHPVQGNAGGALQHPAQQDIAQFRPAAVEHQQYAQRRRPPDPRAGDDRQRDRPAPDARRTRTSGRHSRRASRA